MSCFGSRHGSTTKLTELHGSKISLVSNPQADLEAAIRLLQEVKKNASPEDLAALRKFLLAPTSFIFQEISILPTMYKHCDTGAQLNPTVYMY
jgi:hypothetical protein